MSEPETQELIAPHLMKPPPGPPPEDIVRGHEPELLDDVTLEYRYSSGREYRLDFTAEKVTFTMLSSPNWRPEFAVPVSLPYLTRTIRENLINVHWMVPGRVGHVTLTIDFAARKIFVSALMPFKMEFFDVGEIYMVKTKRPG